MILIDAMFIANEGGAPNLLRYLLNSIMQKGSEKKFFVLADARFEYDLSAFEHLKVNASIGKRYHFYRANKKKFSRVFCFANTPPPVNLKVPVDTYFHNQMILESKRHLLDRKYHRFFLRYLYVKLFNRNTDNYIVQTPHMVDEIVSSGLKKAGSCLKFPFYNIPATTSKPFEQRPPEFVYVSSASFYKNHTTLLNAWEKLYEQGEMPVLHLTVPSYYSGICTHIDMLRQKGMQIINHGYTDPGPLYANYAYLIYPSLNESFGLSLVEAATAGMKILAADLPYVKSVVKPSASFEPTDIASLSGIVSYAIKNAVPFPEILIQDHVDGLIEYLLN